MNYRHNILFPGSFKPVHSGHITLVRRFVDENGSTPNITIIISQNKRDNLDCELSKWFFDNVFKNFRNVHTVISQDKSPVMTAYNMTSMKNFGDGGYSMISSNKDYDIKRVNDYMKMFAPDGKYHTEGVVPIRMDIDELPVLYKRNDSYNGTPISGTVARNDIDNDDFENFRTSYQSLIDEGFIKEALVREYFNRLKEQYRKTENVTETAAAGHMNHPYDYDDMTFGEIRKLVADLFDGTITDVTEKLDGINVFVSVDELGRTIFARNKSQLCTSPVLLDDVVKTKMFPDKLRESVNAGIATIDAVIKNIPDRKELFNIVSDNEKTRRWINAEMVDCRNCNVIPYTESFVSFHGIRTMSIRHNSETKKWVEIKENSETEIMKIVGNAVKKTDRTLFKAQVTPKVIIEEAYNKKELISKYNDMIDDIIEKYSMKDSDTLMDYKKLKFLDYICGDNGKSPTWVCDETVDKIVNSYSTYTMKDIKREIGGDEIKKFRDFYKTRGKKVVQKIMLPIDRIFISLGNDVIKTVDGLKNQGNELNTINGIKRSISHAIDVISKSNDEDAKNRLEYLLVRLSDKDVNPTEGVVVRYNGRTFKLTGSFAPINQIINLKVKR